MRFALILKYMLINYFFFPNLLHCMSVSGQYCPGKESMIYCVPCEWEGRLLLVVPKLPVFSQWSNEGIDMD